MASNKLLLITGVSSGFGRALLEQALAHGHHVVGTVRNVQAAEAFEALCPARAHARLLDVTQFDAIDGVVADIEANVGAVDVLVNNAGYGHEGIRYRRNRGRTRLIPHRLGWLLDAACRAFDCRLRRAVSTDCGPS